MDILSFDLVPDLVGLKVRSTVSTEPLFSTTAQIFRLRTNDLRLWNLLGAYLMTRYYLRSLSQICFIVVKQSGKYSLKLMFILIHY